MDHATLAILMLFVALGLIMAEFFIPSGGLIAILAAVCMAVSIWAAYEAWWESSPKVWWSYLATVALLTPLSIFGAFFLIQRTSLGDHILLKAPSLDEVTPFITEGERLATFVGKRGKTVSLLNPGGMVSVEGERFHCESPGLMIEAGEDVEVTAVKGIRLVVVPATGPADSPDIDSAAADDSQDELAQDELASNIPAANGDDVGMSPLDFDIPQS